MNGQMGMFDEDDRDDDEQEPEAEPEFKFHDASAQSAASMNEVDSETGRVMNDAPASSVNAAHKSRAKNQREIAYEALVAAGPFGHMTAIKVAAKLPLTRQGGPQVSNRAASRLGELWEAQRAYVVRERGRCTLGVCHPHEKPRVIHRPTAPCELHGKPIMEDGASIWRYESK